VASCKLCSQTKFNDDATYRNYANILRYVHVHTYKLVQLQEKLVSLVHYFGYVGNANNCQNHLAVKVSHRCNVIYSQKSFSWLQNSNCTVLRIANWKWHCPLKNAKVCYHLTGITNKKLFYCLCQHFIHVEFKTHNIVIQIYIS